MNSPERKNDANPTQSSASTQPAEWNDYRMEQIIGTLLRTGVLLSATVVCIGGIIHLARHGHSIADYSTFHGELSPLRTLTGIVHGALHRSGSAIIQLGLLLLIATPIARVVFSAIAFFRERNYLYVAFTLTVLAVLAYGLFGAGLR
jgi:uncharacterized membrane protein